tara:strand:+ start:185 stop:640 length:456 start_codon:yes stop_codon:yes gene_type:complete
VGGLILVPATEFAQVADGGDSSSSNNSWGEPVEHHGKGWKPFKGEGKGGSLGTPLDTPVDASNELVSGPKKVMPKPLLANTKADVQYLFDTKYFKFPETPFWNGKNLWHVNRGTHVLWKNIPKGKNGGESTKHEVFHGECHGWEGDQVIVS